MFATKRQDAGIDAAAVFIIRRAARPEDIATRMPGRCQAWRGKEVIVASAARTAAAMPHAVAADVFADGLRAAARSDGWRADGHAPSRRAAAGAGGGFVAFGYTADCFERAALRTLVVVDRHGVWGKGRGSESVASKALSGGRRRGGPRVAPPLLKKGAITAKGGINETQCSSAHRAGIGAFCRRAGSRARADAGGQHHDGQRLVRA
ncbi:hypothetical protein BURKHO8Y_180093 [Burkholderia sp. 8Y]|nr:hypothetical protein BURKHO8Y_180093 [Burkholderia sp. 8Y]